MGSVVAIGKHQKQQIRVALEALLKRNDDDELLDLAIMWQVRGRTCPEIVALGRYDTEPDRATAAIERFRRWNDRRGDAQDSA
jgi:hypothetical protein